MGFLDYLKVTSYDPNKDPLVIRSKAIDEYMERKYSEELKREEGVHKEGQKVEVPYNPAPYMGE